LWLVPDIDTKDCPMNLLVVEDEPRMAKLLRRGLCEEGHAVMCAFDGTEGLQMALTHDFDVVILDVMMPKLDGYELAARLRATNNAVGVLMLTAKDSIPDIVRGLNEGADDYVTKPFSFHELLLRLRSVQRRATVAGQTKFQVADLILDRATREVTRAGAGISLTRTEYSVLERLMRDAGRVVARPLLIGSVWSSLGAIESNTLDAFMRLLRNKIDRPGQQKLIHTVRGAGYVIAEENHA
jgi:DNA-binding response OmpR family regulator